MSDPTETPNKETGSVIGDGNAETPDSTINNQEAGAKPDGTVDTTGLPADAGETVFSGEEKGGQSQFQTIEAAEKSWKESQKYASQLEKELAEARAAAQAPAQAVQAPPAPTQNRELEALKAELRMNNVFDDYASKNPDFKGTIRTFARDIITTHIQAGKSIKLDDAVAMAKAKAGIYSDAEQVKNAESQKAAAGFGGSRPGTPSYNGQNVYQPTTAEQKILNGLKLSPERKQKVLERMANGG